MDKIVGLVVAGGYSSRMGDFKPLLPLGEETVIESSIKAFLKAGLKDIRVVVGHRADEIIPILKKHGVKAIFNAAYDQGMYSSIVAGVKSFEADVEGFLLLPGDNPLIKQRTIKEILGLYQEEKPGIIYPVFNGERGHPPLISTKYVSEILAWQEPGGMKALLKKFEKEAVDLPVIDQGILMDMDTKIEYRKMLSYYSREGIPTQEEGLAILHKYNTPSQVIKHGEKVAKVAGFIGFALNGQGCQLNIKLLRASGLLHDIAKGEPNHAEVGAHILRQLGFSKVADIIETHTDIVLKSGHRLNENEILYIADKLVKGEKLVTIQERFKSSLAKFKSEPEIYSLVKTRYSNAEIIKRKIETELNITLKSLLKEVG